jgi:D-glycero-D-manno-heptose 1,7-bisphosphate phosphatase
VAKRVNSRKAVFLDLQGTLGGEGLGDIRDFSFFPFSAAAIRCLNDAGLLAIVTTGQSKISKGYFTYADFLARMEDLKRELADQGARLDAVYCCPHISSEGCACHKPRPGMLLQAQAEWGIDMAASYVVGDAGAWDMRMARAAGCTAILVRTGLGQSSLAEFRHLWADTEADFVAADVLEAAHWIRDAEQAGRPRTGFDGEL